MRYLERQNRQGPMMKRKFRYVLFWDQPEVVRPDLVESHLSISADLIMR